MPLKRQIPVRSSRTNMNSTTDATTATATRRTTRTASNTRTTVASGSQDYSDELASELSERLMMQDAKTKKKALTSNRPTRSRAACTDGELARAPHARVTKAKIEQEVPKRTHASRSAKPLPGLKTADGLASDLQQKLTLGTQEDEILQSDKTSEERRVETMRVINSTSKALSEIAASGWTATCDSKAARGRHGDALVHSSTVLEHAQVARDGLSFLRNSNPGDVDIERAAVNLAGKLNTLEMFDQSLEILHESHSHIVALYDKSSISRTKTSRTSILSLPIPAKHDTDDVVQTLISSYLLHALTALSYLTFRSDNSTCHRIEDLHDTLYNKNTLIHWLPHFNLVPTKHKDSVLTRAYTSLNKASAQVQVNSLVLATVTYQTRVYGLTCLAHVSLGVLDPNTFWNQVAKTAASYIKDVDILVGNKAADITSCMGAVSATFSELIEYVCRRNDKASFISGRGFLAFCEYWTSCAKRANDLHALERVRSYIQLSSATSPPSEEAVAHSPSTWKTSIPVVKNRTQTRTHEAADAAEAARLYALFTQATAVLEKDEWAENANCLEETLETMGRCTPFLRVAYEGADREPDDDMRNASRVLRSFERMRRAAAKALDASKPAVRGAAAVSQPPRIATILLRSIDILGKFVNTTSHDDVLSALLDSCFVLARSSLVILDTTTYARAYGFLEKAASFLSSKPAADHALSHANFLRCVSGAFHNIAATLCQASRYDFAIRFLDRSCAIGEEALRMCRVIETRGDGDSTKSEEAWIQLEDQLHRRWEILGVCHSKTSDRKMAFTSFYNCVRTFPYQRYDFHRLASGSGSISMWESSELKHLAGIIDRLTYLGLCDLYKDPCEVSLGQFKHAFSGIDVNDEEVCRSIIGALLERQVQSLQGSIWKLPVQNAVHVFLTELLELYDARTMPVHRARVLLRQLELLYHQETVADRLQDSTIIEDIVAEAEDLLTAEDALMDSPLENVRPYYLIMLKLRHSLLLHRSAQTSQFSRVVTCAEEACKLLKRLSTLENNSAKAKESPQPRTKKGPTRAQAAGGRAKTKYAKTATAVPVTPRRKTARGAVSHTAIIEETTSSGSSAPVFDDMPRLIDLLRAVAQLLGLLGQVVTKVRVLLHARRIAEQVVESRTDDFVKLSVDLAHEYVKLGKPQKAANIYRHTLNAVKTRLISDETRVFCLLRYAESLAVTGNVLKSSTTYCDACNLSEDLPDVEKGTSTTQRVIARSARLERAAIASSTFALIQYSRDDPAVSIEGHLQSLRLWNRALETLQRLIPLPPSKKDADESNPFLVDDTKESANSHTNGHTESTPPDRQVHSLPALNGLEWRIAEGALGTLFSLVNIYNARGSPREAEYFAQQAQVLAQSLGTPAMSSRAFARIGEIKLHLGKLQESYESLTKAAELASGVVGPDTAEIQRLRAEYSRRSADEKGAQELYEEAISMLEELDDVFVTLDGIRSEARLSLGGSPTVQNVQENLVPELLVAVLRQNILLLRSEGGEYQALLERLRSVSGTAESQAEQNALMERLTMDNVYGKFQADMFLSSLTESTITLPMGSPLDVPSVSSNTHEILNTLANAENLFWSDLALVAKRGKVFHVRDTAISLALIRAFQASLGKNSKEGPTLAARLLDSISAITLRREVLEAVLHKFRDVNAHDDLDWPLMSSNGSPLPPNPKGRLRFDPALEDDSDEDIAHEKSMKPYWDSIKKKYESYGSDASYFSSSLATDLPSHWTVISISVTEDKNTMFVTRQMSSKEPLIICIPLKGRRENDEEEQLTFDDAMAELNEIIHLSDEGTKQAVNVRNDRDARASWWAARTALDQRLKELLENIEFCWLGAFKAILSAPSTIPLNLLSDFRRNLEQVFQRSIVLRDKRQKTSVRLDDALVECFASLSPKCKDEELEDVIYFILDLYQFHGIPVASAEVDIDQAVIDLRAALEDFMVKSEGHVVMEQDPHMFLILDKNVQGVPWESMPILRGRSVSRIPSMDFLLDRLEYIKWQKTISNRPSMPSDRLSVNPQKVFYVLNPSGDLKNTEGRFVEWLKDMKQCGWEGVVGRPPSEQQLADALTRKDLVLYFGHGGAEQYIRSHKVRHLTRCAATMLWGCSSGSLKDMGDFDRTGTPHNYMLAGCPSLVANLWDVTDRDIDKFAQSVLEKISLNAEGVHRWGTGTEPSDSTSVVSAVARSREVCKLKYLTGAAPVVYGIPFYL